MNELRELVFFRQIFLKFYLESDLGIQKKYDHVFVIMKQAEKIPVKFFKKITGSKKLFEIRIEYQSNTYRTFCCFDGNNLVILFNSFHKKTQKTPKGEIKRAEKLIKEYFNEKN